MNGRQLNDDMSHDRWDVAKHERTAVGGGTRQELPLPFGTRSDATRCKDVSQTRAIIPFLTPGRNQGIVFFEQEIDVTKTFAVIAKLRQEHGVRVTFLHLLLMASTKTLAARPRLNRFVAGHRLWQRDGIWLSFSAKREKSDAGAVVVVKKKLAPTMTLGEVIRVVEGAVGVERSGKPTYTDKELAFFLKLPAFLLAFALRLLRRLDHGGWLPRSFIDNDPLFASMFIANLGSIQMDAGFHHLFEYGNVTTFCTAGQSKVVLRPDLDSDDESAVRRVEVVPLRYSFDERVEDGLYAAQALDLMREALEDPETHLDLRLEPQETSRE